MASEVLFESGVPSVDCSTYKKFSPALNQSPHLYMLLSDAGSALGAIQKRLLSFADKDVPMVLRYPFGHLFSICPWLFSYP
jgi:hypothetical protein